MAKKGKRSRSKKRGKYQKKLSLYGMTFEQAVSRALKHKSKMTEKSKKKQVA